MVNIKEATYSVIKAIFDLTFTLNMMPLRRSTVIDLGIEPTKRLPFFKYASWILQVLVFLPKAISFLHRSILYGISVYSVLHFYSLLQIAVGLFCVAATIVKADEALTYFKFHRTLCKTLEGLNSSPGQPWWSERRTQGLLFWCIGSYVILFSSLLAAYLTLPEEPMFFQSFAAHFLGGWSLVAISTVCEVFSLTAAAVAALFATLCGMSYIFVMSSLSRLDWNSITSSEKLEHLIMIVDQIRLLSDLANDFWQFSYALAIPTYFFVNLTMSLSATVTGANSLPVLAYAILPTASVSSVLYLMCFVPVVASVYPESQSTIGKMKRALTQLRYAGKPTRQLFKRKIRSQRPFGFKLGKFSFISLETAQDVITNSVSYSLIISALTKI